MPPALARNRVKVEHGILSHPTHARIGEAYLASFVASLPEPAGARIQKLGPRGKHDQESFKRLIRNAYSPQKGNKNYDASDTEDLSLLWCPVTREWYETEYVTTAHLVPYAIGEIIASYIFGLPIGEGWNALWSPQNGLLVYLKVERAMDQGQLLIVPEFETALQFKIVLLDESLANASIYRHGPKFGDLHNRRLLFITGCRPGKRYLYFLCLTTLFRRHRFLAEDVKGTKKSCKWAGFREPRENGSGEVSSKHSN